MNSAASMVPFCNAWKISRAGRLTTATPTRLSISWFSPAVRKRRPRKSSMVLISSRNQPNHCGPLLPQRNAFRLNRAYISSYSAWPPPWFSQPLCSGAVRPNGIDPKNRMPIDLDRQ